MFLTLIAHGIEKLIQLLYMDNSSILPASYAYYYQKKLSLLNLFAEHYSFFLYQKSFLQDNSRFKFWLKSRQIGGSWTASLDLLLDSFLKGVPAVVLTAHSDILDSFREQFHGHFQVLCAIFPHLLSRSSFSKKSLIFPPLLYDRNALASSTVTIRFILSNPRTARGFNGSVLLDEFAFHQDPKSIFYSVLPMVTRNYLYSLLIISTPNVQGDFFFKLIQKLRLQKLSSAFSLHKTSIYDAKRDGLNINLSLIKEFMEAYEFRRAYLCEFSSSSQSIFNSKILKEATLPYIDEDFKIQGLSFLGYDIGRRRDLSVLVLIEKLGNKLYLRKIITLRSVPFHKQILVVRECFEKYRVNLCVVDASGMGMPIAESLQMEWGDRVFPFFPNALKKESLVFSMKWALMQKNLYLIKDKFLFDEFLALSFDMFRRKFHSPFLSEDSSHCDRFWAFVYAFYGAQIYQDNHKYASENLFERSYSVSRSIRIRDYFI